MANWKTSCVAWGLILCLGALDRAGLLTDGTAIAADASAQSAIGGHAATGPPRTLGPGTRKPPASVRHILPATRLEPRPTTSEYAVEQNEATPAMSSIKSFQRVLRGFGHDQGPIDRLTGPGIRNAVTAYKEGKQWNPSGMANSWLKERLIADRTPRSRANSISARPPATSEFWTDAGRSTAIFFRGAAANVAVNPKAPAEPPGVIELAVIDLFNFLRATSQFAVHLFVDPKPRDSATTNVDSAADSPGSANRSSAKDIREAPW